MTQPAHSKLGASSYDRYKACPGSIRESEGIVKASSEYAKEGTFAHGVAELMLHGKKMEAGDTVTIDDHGEKVTGEVTEEMLEAVQVYVDYVHSHNINSWDMFVEKRFNLEKYHKGLYGTADCVLYDEKEMHLKVVDYKHGRGVGVEVVENGEPNCQLMFYGLGALHELKLKVRKVTLVIVQPRCYHQDGPVREIDVSPVDVLDFSFQLIFDAKETEKPDAPLHAGDHCRWCPASHKCVELKSRALECVKSPFTPALDYDPEELSKVLKRIPEIEAYIKAVDSFAYSEAVAGRPPPGFKLVDKRATRKWTEEDPVYKTIYKNSKLKHADIFTEKLRSPAQVEKLLTKEEFALLTSFISQVSSGQALVPDSDNRKQVAKKDSPFAQIE